MTKKRYVSQQYSIPWGAWHSDTQLKLTLPEHWEVETVHANSPCALTDEAIAQVLENPIDTHQLSELAQGKKNVVVAVDDLTRPACLQPVVDALLMKFANLGISCQSIRIIVGVGAHKPLAKMDLEKKLGYRSLERVEIFCHDANADLLEMPVGNGKSVPINRIFAEADLKITISTVTPHLYAGYSGGAKMVLPGLAGMEAITYTHKSVLMGLAGKLRQVEGNRFRTRIESIARCVGVDYSIQLVVNNKRQIAGVFAGEIVSAHRAAVQYAETVYTTDFPKGLDVVVLNAYPKDTELLQIENAFIAYRSARDLVKEDGVVVLTAACSQGIGTHGLFGAGQILHRSPRPLRFLEDRHLIVYTPGITEKEFYSLFWERYSFYRQWQDVVTELQQRYAGSCKVGVIPCASLQMANTT